MQLSTNPGFREGTVPTELHVPCDPEGGQILTDLQGALGLVGARAVVEQHVGKTMEALLDGCTREHRPAFGCRDWLTYR